MRKLTILFAVLAISIMSFAQGTITYELNGGVTNQYGWKNKAEMLLSLMEEYKETFPNMVNSAWKDWAKDSLGTVYVWDMVKNRWALLEDAQGVEVTSTVIMNTTYATTLQLGVLLSQDKWMWLHDYIDSTRVKTAGAEKKWGVVADGYDGTHAGQASETEQEALWRHEVAGFFFGSPSLTDYRHTNNYVLAGQLKAFQPAWKQGFDGPAQYGEGEVVSLSDALPYKEGESFLGWYADAAMRLERRTEISGSGDVKLYARFGDYIPTTKEFGQLEIGTDTTTQGTVTFIHGNDVYIQDETGAIVVVMNETPNVSVNDQIVVAGTVAMRGGVAVVSNPVVRESIKGKPAIATATFIADIVDGGAQSHNMNLLVQLEGVKLCGYADNGDALLTDGTDTIQCIDVKLDQNNFSPGIKIDAIVVVGYSDGVFYFLGNAENFTKAATAGKDPSVYDKITIGEKTYSLSNDWLYAVTLNNYTSNRPNEKPMWCRAWIQYNGKMYFTWRNHENAPTEIKLKVVDAETGTMLDDLYVADNVFKLGGKADTTGLVFGAMQDIKLDDAGHAVLCNLPTSNKAEWQVWTIDLETGEGRMLVNTNTMFEDYPDYSIRFDACGVKGDINGDAVIMAAAASASEVYWWRIKNGEWDGKTRQISCDLSETIGSNFGTAPQIFPIEIDPIEGPITFYVDGFSDYPVLFDGYGDVLEHFTSDSPQIIGSNGKARATGHNGLIEFEMGGEYFLLMAGDNTNGAGGLKSTFVLYKCKNMFRAFDDMEQLWEFPGIGMGGQSNGYRTATPSVLVDEEKGIAHLYVYTGENGYGAYTFSNGKTTALTSVQNDANEEVKKVLENGTIYIIRNNEKYTPLGIQVR